MLWLHRCGTVLDLNKIPVWLLSISSLARHKNARYSIFGNICYDYRTMATQEILLLPDPSDAREMEVFSQVPLEDQQAWLTFVRSAHDREAIGIVPTYTFNQFNKGLASRFEGLLPVVDSTVAEGIGGVALIPNYIEASPVRFPGHEVIVEPVLKSFENYKGLIERHRKQGPVAIIAPHGSLATPYVIGRALSETVGPDVAKNIYTVIGPRPTVMEFEIFDKSKNERITISPVMLGRAIANLILTGPDTDSARKNIQLADWLKKLRVDFWSVLDEVMEPREDGNNNIVIFCPAGRVAEKGKEFRVDGSFEYLTKYEKLSIWPVGVFDRLLLSNDKPQSEVYINPDKSMWWAQNEAHANYLHKRSVDLSQSPLGGLEFESQMAHNARLMRQKIFRRTTKDVHAPYLSA